MGFWDLITLISRAFLFVSEGEHLILVLLYKADLEHKEICASDWLKHPISTLLTHIHFVFLFYIPDLALCYKKPIHCSSVDREEEHEIMILEIIWCPVFTPLVILLGGVKTGHVPFLSQVCLVFYPKSLKAVFLTSKVIDQNHLVL